jgi:hypothetical protein
MKQNTRHISRGGEYKNMIRFELDRLFGLALTDARFFRQLRECPGQAIMRFDLTESEARAVLDIAPEIKSIHELAVQLDLWMTRTEGTVTQEPMLAPAPALHHLPLPGLGRHPEERPYTHTPDTIQEKEQGICLTLSEYIAQS